MNAERSYVALGTLPNFREGWAIVPFIERPHYWRADGNVTVHGTSGRMYRSACGLRAVLLKSQNPIVPGNFAKCKLCQRSMTEPAE